MLHAPWRRLTKKPNALTHQEALHSEIQKSSIVGKPKRSFLARLSTASTVNSSEAGDEQPEDPFSRSSRSGSTCSSRSVKEDEPFERPSHSLGSHDARDERRPIDPAALITQLGAADRELHRAAIGDLLQLCKESVPPTLYDRINHQVWSHLISFGFTAAAAANNNTNNNDLALVTALVHVLVRDDNPSRRCLLEVTGQINLEGAISLSFQALRHDDQAVHETGLQILSDLAQTSTAMERCLLLQVMELARFLRRSDSQLIRNSADQFVKRRAAHVSKYSRDHFVQQIAMLVIKIRDAAATNSAEMVFMEQELLDVLVANPSWASRAINDDYLRLLSSRWPNPIATQTFRHLCTLTNVCRRLLKKTTFLDDLLAFIRAGSAKEEAINCLKKLLEHSHGNFADRDIQQLVRRADLVQVLVEELPFAKENLVYVCPILTRIALNPPEQLSMMECAAPDNPQDVQSRQLAAKYSQDRLELATNAKVAEWLAKCIEWPLQKTHKQPISIVIAALKTIQALWHAPSELSKIPHREIVLNAIQHATTNHAENVDVRRLCDEIRLQACDFRIDGQGYWIVSNDADKLLDGRNTIVKCLKDRATKQTSKDNNKYVIIKIFDDRMRSHGINEAEKLGELASITGSNEYVVQRVDFAKTVWVNGTQRSVLVLEAGKANLKQMIEDCFQPSRTLEQIVPTMRKIAECLKFCHDQAHLVHGDLKLENVVNFGDVFPDFRLIDFENCCRMGDQMTKQFTPEYCPPELAIWMEHPQHPANGGEPLRAAGSFDVWCFGVLWLKYLLPRGTELVEFQGLKPDEIVTKIAQPDFSFARSMELLDSLKTTRKDGIHGITPMQRLIAMCTQRIPADRPTFQEILRHGVFNSSFAGMSRCGTQVA